MKRTILYVTIVSFLTVLATQLLFSQSAIGQSPEVSQAFSYQGALTDNDGMPLNGTYDLTLRIYNQASGGTALWQETHSATPVTNGVFNLKVGSVTSLANLSFDETYYLALAIDGGDELNPRTELTSVPSAIVAQKALTVVGPIDGSQIADNSIGLSKVNFDVGSASNANKKKYTVALGLNSPKYCPQGYNIEKISDLAGPDGWLYLYLSPMGTFMGGMNTPNSVKEHLYAKLSTTYATYLCWKTFDSSGEPYTSVFLSYRQNFQCPTGHTYIPRTEIEGSNGYGHVEMNEAGLYMGGLNAWAHTSTTYENGWQQRHWTTHVNAICFKVMGVDGEESETTTGVFPVVLGVRETSACPEGYEHDSVANMDGSNGYVYMVLNDNSATIGGLGDWGYGGENYNQAHFHNTHVTNLCWKFYETIGTPFVSIQTPNAGNCPTDHIEIEADQLKGSHNNHGYIQKTAHGLYMGGLHNWAREGYLDGTLHHTFTSQVSKVCFKVENVIE